MADIIAGHVTDLKDQFVTQISLGKAHAVALTKEGHIYTFGINNKGQCGRDFTPGAAKDGKFLDFKKYIYPKVLKYWDT